jgi:hypothetical protein
VSATLVPALPRPVAGIVDVAGMVFWSSQAPAGPAALAVACALAGAVAEAGEAAWAAACVRTVTIARAVAVTWATGSGRYGGPLCGPRCGRGRERGGERREGLFIQMGVALFIFFFGARLKDCDTLKININETTIIIKLHIQ